MLQREIELQRVQCERLKEELIDAKKSSADGHETASIGYLNFKKELASAAELSERQNALIISLEAKVMTVLTESFFDEAPYADPSCPPYVTRPE